MHRLISDAFQRQAEANLLNLLRADDALLLSHVATLADEIVGQAAYSLVNIDDGETLYRQPALGPIAVAPSHQGTGIGGALVRAGIKAMTDAGYSHLFLVGHPSHYPRFGFQPALPLGFSSDYVQPGGAHEHFMVAILDEVAGAMRGHVKYHPAFDAV